MFLQVDEWQVMQKFSGILSGNSSKNGRLDSQVDCQTTIERVAVSEIEFNLLYNSKLGIYEWTSYLFAIQQLSKISILNLHKVHDCTEDISSLINSRQNHIERKTLWLVESKLGFPFVDFHSEKKKSWNWKYSCICQFIIWILSHIIAPNYQPSLSAVQSERPQEESKEVELDKKN